MESTDNKLATLPTEACQYAGARQTVVTNEFEKPPGLGASVLTSDALLFVIDVSTVYNAAVPALCPRLLDLETAGKYCGVSYWTMRDLVFAGEDSSCRPTKSSSARRPDDPSNPNRRTRFGRVHRQKQGGRAMTRRVPSRVLKKPTYTVTLVLQSGITTRWSPAFTPILAAGISTSDRSLPEQCGPLEQI